MVIPSQKVVAFIQAALECSIFVAPLEPGLSYDEIVEVSKRAGFQEGEVNDALPHVVHQTFGGDGRLEPNLQASHFDIFNWTLEPELRNLQAFDFVFSEFNQLIKLVGGKAARIERSVIVERACSQGLSRNDVEVTITILLLTKQLAEKDNLLMRPHGGIYEPLPSEQRRTSTIPRPNLARAFPIVKDIVERRSDGRLRHAEPLDAFAERLSDLGYAPFRMWWVQTVNELRRSDSLSNPTAVTVFSAAIVEGVLAFVVRHARTISIGPMGSTTFEGDPRSWKIDDLVKSAASGGDNAILKHAVKSRADSLIASRQRIHAGRMLSEFPGGPSDLRPEEARQSKETAEIVTRAVLDWLDLHPPP